MTPFLFLIFRNWNSCLFLSTGRVSHKPTEKISNCAFLPAILVMRASEARQMEHRMRLGPSSGRLAFCIFNQGKRWPCPQIRTAFTWNEFVKTDSNHTRGQVQLLEPSDRFRRKQLLLLFFGDYHVLNFIIIFWIFSFFRYFNIHIWILHLPFELFFLREKLWWRHLLKASQLTSLARMRICVCLDAVPV